MNTFFRLVFLCSFDPSIEGKPAVLEPALLLADVRRNVIALSLCLLYSQSILLTVACATYLRTGFFFLGEDSRMEFQNLSILLP